MSRSKGTAAGRWPRSGEGVQADPGGRRRTSSSPSTPMLRRAGCSRRFAPSRRNPPSGTCKSRSLRWTSISPSSCGCSTGATPSRGLPPPAMHPGTRRMSPSLAARESDSSATDPASATSSDTSRRAAERSPRYSQSSLPRMTVRAPSACRPPCTTGSRASAHRSRARGPSPSAPPTPRCCIRKWRVSRWSSVCGDRVKMQCSG